MGSPSREELVDLAKLAEKEERFDEMVGFIMRIARMKTDLTLEERNMLSLGYKNLVGAKCARERVLTAIKPKEDINAIEDKAIPTQEQSQTMEFICQKMIETVDRLLLNVSSAENSVFYNTM
ncbi:unnamed protein product [Urochloa humidicola]